MGVEGIRMPSIESGLGSQFFLKGKEERVARIRSVKLTVLCFDVSLLALYGLLSVGQQPGSPVP